MEEMNIDYNLIAEYLNGVPDRLQLFEELLADNNNDIDCLGLWRLSTNFLNGLNQTEEQCKDAINENLYALLFVREQTEDLCEYALSHIHESLMRFADDDDYYLNDSPFEDLKILKYIMQTDAVCEYAINLNYKSLQFVRHQTSDICKYAIDKNPDAINYVRGYIPELLTYTIDTKADAIASINDNILKRYIKNKNDVNFKTNIYDDSYERNICSITTVNITNNEGYYVKPHDRIGKDACSFRGIISDGQIVNVLKITKKCLGCNESLTINDYVYMKFE